MAAPGWVRRYGLAAVTVLSGVGVQMALNPGPNRTIPLLVPLLAVVVTAYFGGRGPAIVAALANVLVNWYFFAPPHFSFAVQDPADVGRLAVLAAAAVAASLSIPRLSSTRYFPRVALMLGSSLFLLIVAALVWFEFASSREAERLVKHTYQVLNAAEKLFASMQDADARQQSYLLTGEEEFFDRYRDAVSAERDKIGELRHLTSDNAGQQRRVAELDSLAETRLSQLDRGISVRRREGIDAVIAASQSGEDAHIMSRIRSVLTDLQTEEDRLLTLRTEDAAAQAARPRWVLAGGTALLVALLIFAGVIIERDVGETGASEKALRRQADLLERVWDPIIVWQIGGPIEYWNHGAEELFGFSRQEAVGRSLTDLLHPVHPLGMSEIQEIVGRDGQWRGELTHVIDGREIIVESRMSLITEPDGRKTVLKVNRDVTREKRAQEVILQLNLELEQRVKDRTAQLETANKELETFAYSVSHDLRAPLRGIDGWSLALLEDYGPRLDQNGRQFLERVRSESQVMGRLIDDLLDLSRVSRTELRKESVDMSSLARSVACRLQNTEPTRSMDFVIEGGLATRGDRNLLDVVLSNLLTNAAKFTGPRAQARIEFGQIKKDGELAFFIRDNGVGFDMKYASMLFGAFQRLHKHSEFPGTGIGLATAQRVLQRHGGRIWAESRLNEGATFYFTVGPALV